VCVVKKISSRNEVKTGDCVKHFQRLFSGDNEGSLLVEIEVIGPVYVEELGRDFTAGETGRSVIKVKNAKPLVLMEYRPTCGKYFVLKTRELKF
jgi:hypothetical protein